MISIAAPTVEVVFGPEARRRFEVIGEAGGVIVIDEEHENAFKQESTPRYHARDAALELARNRIRANDEILVRIFCPGFRCNNIYAC